MATCVRISRLLAIAAIVCVLVAGFTTPVRALACGSDVGIVLSDGCLFTITGSDTSEPTDGFAVTNADDVPLWDFVRDKDLQAIGYPISQRWTNGPFTLQAFQKVILQWDPAREWMNYYNTLDALANRYPQIELPNVPTHQVLAEDAGADFATVTNNHLAMLDLNAKIKTRFLAESDWLNLYGLPIRYEDRTVGGNPNGLQVLRTQRTVFEIWNVPAPGTTEGQVQFQNVPDKVKKLDNIIIPNAAKDPVEAYTTPTVPTSAPNDQGTGSLSSHVIGEIERIDWVTDGITPIEQAALDQLYILAHVSQEFLLHIFQYVWVAGLHSPPTERDLPILGILIEIAALPWIQDGITEAEHQLVQDTYSIRTAAMAAMREINELAWIQDGITPIEQVGIGHLENLANLRPDLLVHIIQDKHTYGIHNAPTNENIANLELILAIADIPWIRNSPAEPDYDQFFYLYRDGRGWPSQFQRLLVKPWVRDGLTKDEEEILHHLSDMATSATDLADDDNAASFVQALIDMPFLQSIEGFDRPAMRSLQRIRFGNYKYFTRIVSQYHGRGGITDRDAKIVPVIDEIVDRDPSLLDKFINQDGIQLEERVISLPRTGTMHVGIIRLKPGLLRTMDYLERAIRQTEDIMNEPYPTKYIALLVSDTVKPYGGWYYGTHITMQPGYDDGGHYFSEFLDRVLTHEVAHYYWHSCPSWLCEGGAVFVEIRAGILSSSKQQDLAHRCSQTGIQNIVTDHTSNCRYFLGARMLHDLYFILGEDLFQVGFQRLYHATQGREGPESCEGIEIGLCYLRYAFTQDTTPDAAAVAGEFISRWYHGYSSRFN